jgi:hypothetical protein
MTSKVCKNLLISITLFSLTLVSASVLSAQVRRLAGPTFSVSVAAAPGHKVSTNKNAYKFNEKATIEGKSFTPLGIVRMSVVTDDGFMAGAIADWNVYADASGEFTTEWLVAYPAERFTVKAADVTAAVEAGTDFIVMGSGANLDQCRNGANGSPVQCIGSAWVNGNLNASQASYLEGESVPYRMLFSGLTVGAQNTVTIEWDTTVSKSTHAIDYLTMYNRSETDADPCTGVAGCNPAVYSTAPIPVDPMVAMGHDGLPGTADDIVQVPGVFTLWGGTIDSVSGYSMTGTFDGASATRITVTFTAGTTAPILAWGGHISTRSDWGEANSAVAISGSPFHMRLYEFNGSPGGQDRAIQSDAVIFPAALIVIVAVQPQSSYPFTFSSTGIDVAAFTLDDNGIESDGHASTFMVDNITLFGAANQIKITEDPPMHFYTLVSINCVSSPAPGLSSGKITTSLVDRQAVLEMAEGETVTCTFLNTSPTSARVAVAGNLADSAGRALPNVLVTAVKLSTGEMTTARTNMFGFYRLADLEAGEDYVIQPRSLRHNFEPGATMLHVTRNENGLNFTAAANP